MRHSTHGMASLLALIATTLLMTGPNHAALPVEEVGPNLLANKIQAVQAVAMVANQILDLTPMGDLLQDDQMPGEILGILVNLACFPQRFALSLSFSLAGICAEFAQLYPPPEQVPDTAMAFAEWQAQKREQTRVSAAAAARAQALTETLQGDIPSLAALLGQILGIVGNMQGLQIQHQLSAQQNLHAIRLQIMHASFQRAVTTKLADEATAVESLRRINRNVMADHPR